MSQRKPTPKYMTDRLIAFLKKTPGYHTITQLRAAGVDVGANSGTMVANLFYDGILDRVTVEVPVQGHLRTRWAYQLKNTPSTNLFQIMIGSVPDSAKSPKNARRHIIS